MHVHKKTQGMLMQNRSFVYLLKLGSLCIFVSVCLSLSLCLLCLSSLSVCLSVCMSLSLSVCLSLSLFFSFSFSLSLSLYLSIYLCISLLPKYSGEYIQGVFLADYGETVKLL